MATVVSKENSSKRVNERKKSVVFSKFPEEKFYLTEEIKALEKGEYALVMNWEDVETVLESFADNEDFELAELSNGIFAILPTLCIKSARKEFDEMPRAKRK